MNKQEFGIFASAMRTYYSKENLLPNAQAIELWYRELKDIPYAVAETILRKWVATNKWSPSIAEIREEAATMVKGELPDWGEAWAETCKAISRYGIYRQKEALDSLKPLTRQTVERLGFSNLCMSENQTADRANFRQCYDILQKREQTDQRIALPLQNAIKAIQGGEHENEYAAVKALLGIE